MIRFLGAVPNERLERLRRSTWDAARTERDGLQPSTEVPAPAVVKVDSPQ